MTAPLPHLPLVGRSRELEQLRGVLELTAARREPASILLHGESGVGKTRLLQSLTEWANRSGWSTSIGTAYPVEAGVPYAALTDALDPLVRDLDPASLSAMVRGATSELALVLPRLAEDRPVRTVEPPEELRPRVLWSVTRLLQRIASRRPLLFGIDNLQWTDFATLELLHFAARQAHGVPLVMIGTLSDLTPAENDRLSAFARSMRSQAHTTVMAVPPLDGDQLGELVAQTFGAPKAVIHGFASLLFRWTRGNVFFAEETLKALIAERRLVMREGHWEGFDDENLVLPASVREALLVRLGGTSPPARQVADLLAVLGARIEHRVLADIAGLAPEVLFEALAELRRQRLVQETDVEGDVAYELAHPMIRETLAGELGRARARAIHGSVAAALERVYGDDDERHAHELAYHYLHAERREEPLLRAKAVRYLTIAGNRALDTSASREAASFLAAALERMADDPVDARIPVMESLARARQRLGEYREARELWVQAVEWSEKHDRKRLPELHRRLALTAQWSGRLGEALQHYDDALAASDDPGMRARVLLARGMCRQVIGDASAARADVETARTLAAQVEDRPLLARLHRAHLLLALWTGSPEEARHHGNIALALARETEQKSVECTVHWALGMLGGLSGNEAATRYHTSEAERLAEKTNSPVLKLWVDEIAIELASATGDWETALMLGDRGISLARVLDQRALLPRLLVWTAIVRLARGEHELGVRLIDEAWEVSGAATALDDSPRLDVHSVVPAHTGRAFQHLVAGEYDDAIRVAEAGLAIADRCGYPVWTVHRLIPVLCEACLRARDLDRALRYGEHLARESERLGHPLGRAWAMGAAALLPMVQGDRARAIGMLREAVAALESVPFVYDAARMRKELASQLAAAGDRDEAIRELRIAHDVLLRLGAAPEVDRTREDLRRLGARPPARSTVAGTDRLTGREIEIIRLIGARRSNKEIGIALGISPRTVSTHLSNIFTKLEVATRGELADFARTNGID